MVHPHEQADTVLGQSGEKPHLPQRARSVQALSAQLLDHAQEHGLVGGAGQGSRSDVLGDVERGGVNPQRAAELSWGHAQKLPEPGDEMQTLGDEIPHGADP